MKWKTFSGELIDIKDMRNEHLTNVINHLFKRAFDKKRTLKRYSIGEVWEDNHGPDFIYFSSIDQLNYIFGDGFTELIQERFNRIQKLAEFDLFVENNDLEVSQQIHDYYWDRDD